LNIVEYLGIIKCILEYTLENPRRLVWAAIGQPLLDSIWPFAAQKLLEAATGQLFA
jgi:hypothetical protein